MLQHVLSIQRSNYKSGVAFCPCHAKGWKSPPPHPPHRHHHLVKSWGMWQTGDIRQNGSTHLMPVCFTQNLPGRELHSASKPLQMRKETFCLYSAHFRYNGVENDMDPEIQFSKNGVAHRPMEGQVNCTRTR